MPIGILQKQNPIKNVRKSSISVADSSLQDQSNRQEMVELPEGTKANSAAAKENTDADSASNAEELAKTSLQDAPTEQTAAENRSKSDDDLISTPVDELTQSKLQTNSELKQKKVNKNESNDVQTPEQKLLEAEKSNKKLRIEVEKLRQIADQHLSNLTEERKQREKVERKLMDVEQENRQLRCQLDERQQQQEQQQKQREHTADNLSLSQTDSQQQPNLQVQNKTFKKRNTFQSATLGSSINDRPQSQDDNLTSNHKLSKTLGPAANPNSVDTNNTARRLSTGKRGTSFRAFNRTPVLINLKESNTTSIASILQSKPLSTPTQLSPSTSTSKSTFTSNFPSSSTSAASIYRFDVDDAAVQYLVVDDKREIVSISDPKLVWESKAFVGFMGPPGAGKSTLCNTVVCCQHGAKHCFFEPSNNVFTFTKGLWLLPLSVKSRLTGSMDLDVLDMEGFEVDNVSCWKVAMVLCVLAEVVVFCNRDARSDTLRKAAAVFQKGRELTEKLSIRSVTRQIFVQVSSTNPLTHEQTETLLDTLRREVPGIEIVPFSIPDVKNESPHNQDDKLKQLPFHPAVVEATSRLLDRFRIDANGQAAAAKAEAVSELLESFNKGDFVSCSRLGLKFFDMDCKRIYQEALLRLRQSHIERAESLELTSPNTSFEEFVGELNLTLDANYKLSLFYAEKPAYDDHIRVNYRQSISAADVLDDYRSQYDAKVADANAQRTLDQAHAQVLEQERKAKEVALQAKEEQKRNEEKARKLAEEKLSNEMALAAEKLELEREKNRRLHELEEMQAKIQLEQEQHLKEIEEQEASTERMIREEEEEQRKRQEELELQIENHRIEYEKNRQRIENENRELQLKLQKRKKAAELKHQTECKRIAEEREKIDRRKAEFEEERKAAASKEQYLKLVDQCVEAARHRIQQFIYGLQPRRPLYKESLFSSGWRSFLDSSPADNYKAKPENKISIVPDWSRVEDFYKIEVENLRTAWESQISKAKWREPVLPTGVMKCEGGCDLDPTLVICSACKKKMFWCDGPNSMAMCETCEVREISKNLICLSCKSKALCTVRPSTYVP